MTYDRMGRRVTKNAQRFVYNGYLQIANFRSTTTTSDYNYFVWDPTEKVATRPLVWNFSTIQPFNSSTAYYTHDGNKNVSEVVHFSRANGVAAHYEYAPFGEVTAQVRQGCIAAYDFAALNPWRFSSEYADDVIKQVYYNNRHYDSNKGRWYVFDLKDEISINNYLFCRNRPVDCVDLKGNEWWNPFSWGNSDSIVRDDGKWNDPQCVNANNCYEYACDRPGSISDPNDRRSFVNPGEYAAGGCSCANYSFLTCANVAAAAKRDGLVDPQGDNDCPCGYHLVFLVVDKNGYDYHWYRKDAKPFWFFWRGHRWSHKPGSTPVTDKDDDGRYIYDPAKARKNRFYDYKNCGYLCAPNDNK